MAKKRVWFGSMGPHIFNDDSQIMDPQGLVTIDQAGLVTEGKVVILGAPVNDDDAIRLSDLNTNETNSDALSFFFARNY